MPSQKQTRRSISVKGLTYQRLKKYCAANGKTVAGYVEEIIAETLGEPTDEDRRKFGEFQEASDNGDKATTTAQEQPHDSQQEALSDSSTAHEPREVALEPARQPIIEPLPKPEVEPARKPVIEPLGPELARDSTPAPEPKDAGSWDPPKRERPLSKGTPIKTREEEPKDESPEFIGYVSPILEL